MKENITNKMTFSHSKQTNKLFSKVLIEKNNKIKKNGNNLSFKPLIKNVNQQATRLYKRVTRE